MKLRDLRPFTRDAIARTFGSVEDRNRSSPTFDGRCLHIARLDEESHVLHEVAHWLCATPTERTMPNYGLGPDPDGGPLTVPKAAIRSKDEATHLRRLLNEGHVDLANDFVKRMTDHEESLAAVLTISLMRVAGIPWAKQARKIFERTLHPDHFGEFWLFVTAIRERGIDPQNPIAAHVTTIA